MTVTRVLAGTVLAVAALGALAVAILVVALRIGFSPVLSPSMSPAFDAGDLLLTRPVPAADVQVGDAVVLPRPDAEGERYVHRVIELEPGSAGPVVLTKGDNNPAPDPQRLRITSAEVPVVVGHLPEVGRLSLAAGQQTWLRIGLILLVGAGVLVGAKRLILDRSR